MNWVLQEICWRSCELGLTPRARNTFDEITKPRPRHHSRSDRVTLQLCPRKHYPFRGANNVLTDEIFSDLPQMQVDVTLNASRSSSVVECTEIPSEVEAYHSSYAHNHRRLLLKAQRNLCHYSGLELAAGSHACLLLVPRGKCQVHFRPTTFFTLGEHRQALPKVLFFFKDKSETGEEMEKISFSRSKCQLDCRSIYFELKRHERHPLPILSTSQVISALIRDAR